MGISSKLENSNSDSRMIQLPNSGGLNFEASDQINQSSFWSVWCSLYFLSFSQTSKFRWSGTTQASDSIWCSLYKSFRCSLHYSFTQILSVQLIFSVQFDQSGSFYFGAAYIFGSLFFRRDIQSIRILTGIRGGNIWSGWVRSIHCLYRLCVCVLWWDRKYV